MTTPTESVRIPVALLTDACTVTGCTSKTEVVRAALRDYIRRNRPGVEVEAVARLQEGER